MASPKKPNGSPIPTGTLTGLANASKPVTPMLPSFVSSRSRYARTDRPRSARGRLQSWEHLPTDQIIQRRAETTAKADARRRAIGQILTGAFIAVAFAMASVAMHREAQLEQLQPQVERVR